MEMFIYGNKYIPFERISNPSVEEVEISIDSLDNLSVSELGISTSAGSLSIVGGNEGRVMLFFRDRNREKGFQYGKLLDPTHNNSEQHVDIRWSNGQVDVEQLSETVSKETAKEVTRYFLEHQTFPLGLEWRGDMSKITK
jgi:hypothetical protein